MATITLLIYELTKPLQEMILNVAFSRLKCAGGIEWFIVLEF
jgi:hypothetical protein